MSRLDYRVLISTFSFEDSVGREHTVVSKFASDPPAHAVGETLKINYDPADPGSARIDTFREAWFFPLIFGVLAIPPLVIGLLFLLLAPFTIRRVWPLPPVAGTR